MMPILVVLGGLSLAADPAMAADVVTLRDGQVVRGQVVEPAPRGRVMLLVRRAWAEANVPAWAKRWEAIEAPTRRKAKAQRLERLRAWRRDRERFDGAAQEKDDPIKAWLDAEIDRLGKDDGEEPPLMLVSIARGEIKAMNRQPKDMARMLRQGWRAGFQDVETKPLDDLKQALQARGFALGDADPAPVEDLLPVPIESEARWLARRAATEAKYDPGLRFLRHGPLVLPEPRPGEPADLDGA